MLIGEAHRVLFHLGVLDSLPADPRRVHGLSGHYSGVSEPLRALLQYCTLMAATHAPATMKAIASNLAAFGRFLGTFDPPLSDLTRLERQRHIEAWLTALSEARHDDGTSMSVGHIRGQILTVRQFLAQIAEWGWPSAPQRTLIFSRDIPRAPQPLPRYLPPDTDRRLLSVLQQLSQTGESPLARLHADALLLTRATGVRIGELRDLELDCVHEIDGQGAWLSTAGQAPHRTDGPTGRGDHHPHRPDRRPPHPGTATAPPPYRPARRVPAGSSGPSPIRSSTTRGTRPRLPERRSTHNHSPCP